MPIPKGKAVASRTSATSRHDEKIVAAGALCRVVIQRVRPEVDDGRCPIKRTVGESVQVTASIHADGHDALAAVVRYRPVADSRTRDWIDWPMGLVGNDVWSGSFSIDRQQSYEYTVQAWVDRFASWRRGLQWKLEAGEDVSSELLEGSALVRAAARRARALRATHDARWLREQGDLIGGTNEIADRARAARGERLAATIGRFPDRSHATTYDRVLQVTVDRERARFGAWYEMFPRSWGPDPTRSATFTEAQAHLGRVAAMGFDVVYLPPIHPIGDSVRKGRGNALRAEPGDPGSPWAIGSAAGGHKAVDPGLGTLEDFERFCAEARRLGLEVALDLAFQCSPDHPYAREHPEWFRRRPDGTIRFAENPPKKYQDIYSFDLECAAWPALWAELQSIVEFWIARGVLIFRVDNPHTKPYRFWEWLIRTTRAAHPDVIFLGEAFTRPAVMYYLAQLGFAQSYTYFTWRNGRDELRDYFTELTGIEVVEFFRPNLFANTPDILHEYLQHGGRPAFEIRLILAATLGANYGIYSGFELCENRAVPGTEEYLESEKYQYVHWDWDRPGHIKDLVTLANRIRRENPALQSDRSLTFCETDNPQIIAFCKASVEHSNALLVVVNLDYGQTQHGWVRVPLDRLGLPQRDAYEVTDLLDGTRYGWRGEWNYVQLDPRTRVAHILRFPVAPSEGVTLASDALAEFLPQQRWFAGKARTIEKARLVDWAPPGSMPENLVPAIAEVQYADSSSERYFVPLAVMPQASAAARPGEARIGRTDSGALVDALADDGACRALLNGMLENRSVPMQGGTIRGIAYGAAAVAGRWPVIRSGAEHSNSCVVFGNRYVLKLLRRLVPGPNPEIEMSRFLADRGFAHIPPLAASLDYERTGEESTSLALLQGFVANDGTAWEKAVDDAQVFLLWNVRKAPPRTANASATRRSAAALGRRTAELHVALAAKPDLSAFAPEPLAAQDVAAFVVRLRQNTERSLTLLEACLDSLPPPARDRARTVLEWRAGLEAHVGSFGTLPVGSMRTRVHGDYHLGQVLCAGEDFVIIDFEGEPARSLAERRAKQSPLKDVAGMLRSFSYAAHAAVLNASATRPDLIESFEASARLWTTSVSTAFLRGYRQTIAPAALVPADDPGFGQLLNAFLLDKALYELEYELASRPHWVTIPLLGLLQILSGPHGPASIR